MATLGPVGLDVVLFGWPLRDLPHTFRLLTPTCGQLPLPLLHQLSQHLSHPCVELCLTGRYLEHHALGTRGPSL
jgi:hypothetical protein